MNPEKLNYLIEETLSSMDAAERATPAPYLLTRINARMQQDAPGFWAVSYTHLDVYKRQSQCCAIIIQGLLWVLFVLHPHANGAKLRNAVLNVIEGHFKQM